MLLSSLELDAVTDALTAAVFTPTYIKIDGCVPCFLQTPKTPLQKSMDLLGKQLSLYSFGIIGLWCRSSHVGLAEVSGRGHA